MGNHIELAQPGQSKVLYFTQNKKKNSQIYLSFSKTI